ncbi:MAG: hypothetical protein EX269_12270 [Acidimicrobiales bacterium]|nr:MAG: hypothetical protein EX269_12270 [Acidimicrobiales bacterium]
MDDDLTESVELEAYFSALHERFAVHADAPVGATLAEFVDVIDLTPASQPATTSPTNSWRPKMLTGLGAFVATTTGKLVLGTAVAAASVGGMHAAEIVDMPLLPEQAKAEVLMVESEEEATDSGEVEEVAAAQEEADEAEQVSESDAEESDSQDESDENGDEEEPKNHGAVVSDFAKTTDLEGCEKGQAISELAKSKAKKKDADAEDTEDEAEAEELVEEEEDSSKCKSDEEKEGDDDSDDDEDEDEDEDGDGPPEGKGHNREDHPGKGKLADSDE